MNGMVLLAVLLVIETAYGVKKPKQQSHNANNSGSWSVNILDDSDLKKYQYRPGPGHFDFPFQLTEPLGIRCFLTEVRRDGTRDFHCKSLSQGSSTAEQSMQVGCDERSSLLSATFKGSSKKGRYKRDRLLKVDISCSPSLLTGN